MGSSPQPQTQALKHISPMGDRSLGDVLEPGLLGDIGADPCSRCSDCSEDRLGTAAGSQHGGAGRGFGPEVC